MTSPKQLFGRFIIFLLRNRFIALLAALVLMFLVAPCVELFQLRPFLARLLLTVVFIITLIAAVFALNPSRRSRLVAFCLLGPALIFEAMTIWVTSQWVDDSQNDLPGGARYNEHDLCRALRLLPDGYVVVGPLFGRLDT